MCVPLFSSAKIGVGVGTGKIEVNQDLKGGLIYTIPSLVVLNTGDEPSQYAVTIKYREGQSQLQPKLEWFSFSPNNFSLGEGESQVVEIKLALPIKGVVPGDYFAFLSASPVAKAELGGTSLGIAAAAKLYFTVAPSNIISGVYYRVISLVTLYAPWSYVVVVIVLLSLLFVVVRRYFSFNIGINIKRK
jgi:hypothetical protein